MHFHHHAPGAVLLSLLIAFAGCYIALGVMARAQGSGVRPRAAWLAWAGVLFGASIWSMHFTAMLALSVPVPVSYDWVLTAFSAVLACIFTCGGLYIASTFAGAWRLPVAGLVTGAGIVGMHYLGMAALRMSAYLQFSTWSVIAGAAIAVVASTAAFRVALLGQVYVKSHLRHVGATLLGGLAVALFHYTAMVGTQVVVVPIATHPAGQLSPLLLMAVVVLATVIVLGSGLLTIIIDSKAEEHGDLQATLTQLHMRQQLLRRSSRLAEIELDADGRILHVTDAAWELLGHIAAPGGRMFRDFVETADQERCDALLRRALQGAVGEASDTVRLRLRPLPVPIVAAAIGKPEQRRLLLVCETSVDQHRDADTGLPNRKGVLAWTGSPEPTLAVRCSIGSLDELAQMLDPGLFRQLLRAAMEVMQTALADTRLELFARLSTVDFLVILSARGAGYTPGHGADQIETVLNRLARVATLPLWVGGNPWHLPMRLGAAEMAPGTGGEQALRFTAAALHRAEREQALLRRYQAEFDQQWQEQLRLEQELHVAVAEHQFRLVFQPKFDLTRNRLCGAETLLRWQHPQRGLISPHIFIAALESTALIEVVGEWVIDQSLQQWHRLAQAGGGQFIVAINVSPLQLRNPRFVSYLEERRRAYNVAPVAIELEITEGVAMDRTPQNSAVLQELRKRGYRIAIDDFGTGYSSLAYLRDLAIDTLKIDREFIRCIVDDELAARMLGHMVEIGHTLGHQVVAEGVETSEQLAVVRSLGVDKVQGYLIGRPMQAAELIAMLQAEARAERAAVAPA